MSVRTGVEKRSAREALQDISSHHIQASLYHQRIQDYLLFFPRNQIHIIYFEEFVKQPELITQRIFTILDIHPINFSKKQNHKNVNESYQWSGIFNFAKILPLKYVKAFNNTIKRLLPEKYHQAIKEKISKPIPNLDKETEDIINCVVGNDYSEFKKNFSDRKIKI